MNTRQDYVSAYRIVRCHGYGYAVAFMGSEYRAIAELAEESMHNKKRQFTGWSRRGWRRLEKWNRKVSGRK